MNRIPKYVASRTLTAGSWDNTVVLGPDLVSAVREIPEELVVFGSADLLRTLFAHGLVNEVHLLTFPLVIGSGKKMFGELRSPLQLHLEASRTTPSGVNISSYTVG